jgi:hypothetical protein
MDSRSKRLQNSIATRKFLEDALVLIADEILMGLHILHKRFQADTRILLDQHADRIPVGLHNGVLWERVSQLIHKLQKKLVKCINAGHRIIYLD